MSDDMEYYTKRNALQAKSHMDLVYMIMGFQNRLDKLRNEFEQDNEHFMAAFIEAIQYGGVETALRIHDMYVQFLETGNQDLIDERETIRKRWKDKIALNAIRREDGEG